MIIKILDAESCEKILSYCKNNAVDHRVITNPQSLLNELDVTYTEVDYDIDLSSLHLELPNDDRDSRNETDQKNSVLVYEAFSGLTPAQATDERFWMTISMNTFHEYSKKRWAWVNQSDWFKAIRDHFLCKSTVQSLHRDNSLSRLWWMGYALSQAEGMDIRNAAEILFNNSDYRAQVYERRGSTRYDNVRSAILRITEEHMAATKATYNKDGFRSFMKEVNYISGRTVLGALTSEQLIELLKPIYNKYHQPRTRGLLERVGDIVRR